MLVTLEEFYYEKIGGPQALPGGAKPFFTEELRYVFSSYEK
jgi:hypothetical protein